MDRKSRSMLKSKAMMMHSYVEAEAPELLVSTAGTAAGLKCAASPFFMLICFWICGCVCECEAERKESNG
ncbi:hypothetical protein Tco_0903739 [Tanacetum coccineum]